MSKDATRMYSTWRSVDSMGYCDFTFRIFRGRFLDRGPREGLIGDWTLLLEPPLRATLLGGIRGGPDAFEALRDTVELKELCRAWPLILALPAVEGRSGRVEAIA